MLDLKIKVCGMKVPQNIDELVQLPIDYIGFILYDKSKRFIGNEVTAAAIGNIPDSIKKVGVFVNASADYINEKIKSLKLDCVQFHGSESPELCREFFGKTIVIKAFGVNDQFDFSIIHPYKDCCDFFLFDTKSPDHGGTGVKFNWEILEQYDNEKPLFLSGGIGVDDYPEIKKLAWLNIHALDLNSKFEIEPGLKNIALVKRFIDSIY